MPGVAGGKCCCCGAVWPGGSAAAVGRVLKEPLGVRLPRGQSRGNMDSEVQRDGRILDLIDDAWREDKLPYEDVAIPLNELPEPEQDNGGTTESVREQEMKWTDLALQYLHENVPPVGN